MKRYRELFAIPNVWVLVLAAFPARVSYGMVALAIFFKTQQATGSVAAAAGQQGLTFARRSTVSLSNAMGEIRLGRDYTPQFWNHTVYDPFGTNGIGTNLNGAGVSNLIPPMQSFWVRVNPNANPSLNNTGSLGLTNAMRAHFTSINGSIAGLKSTSNERDYSFA